MTNVNSIERTPEGNQGAIVELLESLLQEAQRGELKAITAIVLDGAERIREHVVKAATTA